MGLDNRTQLLPANRPVSFLLQLPIRASQLSDFLLVLLHDGLVARPEVSQLPQLLRHAHTLRLQLLLTPLLSFIGLSQLLGQCLDVSRSLCLALLVVCAGSLVVCSHLRQQLIQAFVSFSQVLSFEASLLDLVSLELQSFLPIEELLFQSLIQFSEGGVHCVVAPKLFSQTTVFALQGRLLALHNCQPLLQLSVGLLQLLLLGLQAVDLLVEPRNLLVEVSQHTFLRLHVLFLRSQFPPEPAGLQLLLQLLPALVGALPEQFCLGFHLGQSCQQFAVLLGEAVGPVLLLCDFGLVEPLELGPPLVVGFPVLEASQGFVEGVPVELILELLVLLPDLLVLPPQHLDLVLLGLSLGVLVELRDVSLLLLGVGVDEILEVEPPRGLSDESELVGVGAVGECEDAADDSGVLLEPLEELVVIVIRFVVGVLEPMPDHQSGGLVDRLHLCLVQPVAHTIIYQYLQLEYTDPQLS